MADQLYDTEILDNAMNHAYSILTGETTFEMLMDIHDEVPLPFNIQEESPDYDGMIEYFIETEEYEKCEVLLKLKKESV
tara:strand:- start:10885 stop:11121 length:237 start_codon:yes stop_codon:yes gene_type:complete